MATANLASDPLAASNILQNSLIRFQSILSKDQQAEIERTSFQDVEIAVRQIQAQQLATKTYNNLNKIRPFINSMQKVIELNQFLNASAISAYVWGPMKLLLQTAASSLKAYDRLLDAYESIGEKLPQIQQYASLFSTRPAIRGILCTILGDILNFHRNAIKFFTRKGWQRLFEPSVNLFESQFTTILASLQRHQSLLAEGGMLAHYDDMQIEWRRDSQQQEQKEEADRRRLLDDIRDWFSPADCQVDHDNQRQLVAGHVNTGAWLLKKKPVIQWLDPMSHISLIWLYGIPGCGKTVLASSVIDHLKDLAIKPATRSRQGLADLSIAYVYCRFDDLEDSRASYHSVLRTLLSQLMEQNLDILPYFDLQRTLYSQTPLKSVKDLSELTKNSLEVLNRVFLIIDGLDEMELRERETLLNILLPIQTSLNEGSECRVKIFISSRAVPDIKRSFQKVKTCVTCGISFEDNRDEIHQYVTTQALKIQSKFSRSELETNEMVALVCNKVERLFLLARLIMENLLHQTDVEELEAELCPDTLPSELSQAYQRIFYRHNKHLVPAEQRKSKEILLLIGYAKRLLKVHEINGALSINTVNNSVDFQKRRLRPNASTQIEDLCSVLVEIRPNRSVTFVHSTARQFYLKTYGCELQHPEMRLAEICLTYLTTYLFEGIDIDKTSVLNGNYSFAEYAIRFWRKHMDDVSQEKLTSEVFKNLREKLMLFLDFTLQNKGPGSVGDPFACFQSCNEIFSHKIYGAALDASRTQFEPLEGYIVKTFEHQFYLFRQVLERNLADFDKTLLSEAYGASPFRCRTQDCDSEGFETAKDRDAHNNKHSKPFKCGEKGCLFADLGFAIQQSLSQHISEYHNKGNVHKFEFPDIDGEKMTIHEAVRKRNYVQVQRLLQKNRDLVKTVKGSRTPLHVAAERGDTKMVQLLLERDADITAESQAGITPLHLAAKYGSLDSVRLLVEKGGHLPVKTTKRETYPAPLYLAAEAGHVDVAKVLLDLKVDVNAQGGKFRNPLVVACHEGFFEIAELLLTHEADANAQGGYYGNALTTACGKGSLEIAELLLKHEADVNAQGGFYGGNALTAACSNGSLEIAELLLKHGADVNAQGGYYGNALQIARRQSFFKIADLLLEHGADANSQGVEHMEIY